MMTEARIVRLVFRFLPVFIILMPASFAGGAEKPAIRELVVNNSATDLLLYLQVADPFRPGMDEEILNGIPATLSFLVSLREVEGGRPGRQVAELAFDHTLSYDVLKEEFDLRFSEHDTELTCSDLPTAKKLMSAVTDARVLPLSGLTPGREYFLSAKVRLERKTLPHFLHSLIPYWQMGDYETDWQYVQFKY
jgi:hypothetical protein